MTTLKYNPQQNVDLPLEELAIPVEFRGRQLILVEVGEGLNPNLRHLFPSGYAMSYKTIFEGQIPTDWIKHVLTTLPVQVRPNYVKLEFSNVCDPLKLRESFDLLSRVIKDPSVDKSTFVIVEIPYFDRGNQRTYVGEMFADIVIAIEGDETRGRVIKNRLAYME